MQQSSVSQKRQFENMSENDISEYQVVDFYFKHELGKQYQHDPSRISKGITDIFANFGLEIVQFDSPAYNTIKMRYNRIVDKIRAQKINKKAANYGLNDPTKQFFSATNFPDLCQKVNNER